MTAQVAVIDGFHVQGNYPGTGYGPAHLHYVLIGHGNGVALQELSGTRIDNYEQGLMRGKRPFYLGAPDRIPGDVEFGVVLVEYKSRYGSHHPPDFTSAVLSPGPVDPQAFPVHLVWYGNYPRKTLAPDEGLVFRLAENGQLLGQ